MAHTKGPWTYQENSDAYTHIVRGPNNEFIGSASHGSDPINEANARLMAAAPELLQSLKEILSLAIEWGKDPKHYTQAEDNLIGFAEAAIAKAEGK